MSRTLETYLKVNDQFSGVFKSMANGLNVVINQFEKLATSSHKGLDPKSIQLAKNELAKATAGFQQLGQQIDKNTQKQNKFNSSVGGAWGKVKSLIGAYAGFQTGKSLIGASDTYSNNTARLNLMNDGLQTTAQLQQKIYEASQRTSSSFSDMTNTVAKLGLTASHAFSNNDEMVQFAELMQKQFAIAGTGTAERSSALYQLTQAMGAGKLQGDEFRSIMENAPMLAKTIADHMNIPITKLKEMSSEGIITSDIIKNALLGSATEINKKYSELPLKFSDLWQQCVNKINMGLEPLYKRLSSIFNNKSFQAFLDSMVNGFLTLCYIGTDFFNVLVNIFSVVYDNWDYVQAILIGIATVYLPTIISMLWTKAKAIWSCVAGWLILNWHIVLIALAIAGVVLLAQKLGITFGQVCGFICGAIMFVGAVIYNIVNGILNVFSMLFQFIAICLAWVIDKVIAGCIGIYNFFSGCCQWIAEACGWLKDTMGIMFDNIRIFWSNLWISAQQMFYKFINSIVSGLSKIATPIKALAKLFGINLGGAFDNMKAGLDNKISELEGKKKEYLKTTSFKEAVGSVDWHTKQYDSGFSFKEALGKIETKTFDYANLYGSYMKGYNWGNEKGSKLSAGVKDMFKDFKNLIPSAENQGLADKLGTVGGFSTPLDKTNDLLKDIANNTAGTNNTLMRNNEDMSYLRDIAERNAINNITNTRHIKLEMTNNNSISSKLDMDEVVNYIGEKIYSLASVSGEGVSY